MPRNDRHANNQQSGGRDDRYFHVQPPPPSPGLDPQQRAREYRQRHRDDGWTRNERQRLHQLQRRADRALRTAEQPDQTSPMEVVENLPDPTSEYLGRSLVQRVPGGFRSSVNTAIQLADDTIAWVPMVMEDPPPVGGFNPLRTWSIGTPTSSKPAYVSAATTGNLWIVDHDASRVWFYNGTTGAFVSSIDVVGVWGGAGGANIGGIDVLSDNRFWWYYGPSSAPNHKLFFYDASAGFISSITISTTSLAGHQAIAAAAAGSPIFITDEGDNQVERWSSGGSKLGDIGPGGTDMARPNGVCVDPSGNIWISDWNQHWVRKYDGSSFAKLFQIGPGLPGSADGQFNGPRGLHATSSKVYVADTGNHRIQVFDLNGSFLGKFGGPGNGPSQFSGPWDVTFNGTTVSIADYGNHRISQWSDT